MTPKNKAIELFNKYAKMWHASTDDVKNCATIAVEEILKNFEGLPKPEYCAFDAIGERKFTFHGEYDTHMTGYDMIAYWEEVKIEIKNL